MKISNWNNCIESNSSKQITPDIEKARSLIETADGKIVFLKLSKVNNSNANYIFKGYYSSVLELIHAILLLDGFKVNNHICVGFYLRDVVEKKDLFRIFDDCRYKRNSLVYYGNKMEFVIAEEAIGKCKYLVIELEKRIKEKIKS